MKYKSESGGIAARQTIVGVIEKLEDAGEIVIVSANQDEIIE